MCILLNTVMITSKINFEFMFGEKMFTSALCPKIIHNMLTTFIPLIHFKPIPSSGLRGKVNSFFAFEYMENAVK